jgi:cyclic pyranopterin phosphate synthase
LTIHNKGERGKAEDMAKLVDPYGRAITSLRISLTQKCNFNCFFCHQEGENHSEGEMTLHEIHQMAEVASHLGIEKIKLTGGEPLLREDISEIVESISPLVKEVSMTTNGALLFEKACELKSAGLERVNVSLHSLKPENFRMITCVDSEEVVRRGIEQAIECELNPVKLNMVVMKGVNHDEIQDMLGFAKSTGSILQLIEYQALERGQENYEEYHYDLNNIEEKFAEMAEKIIERPLHRRRQYWLPEGAKVEIVRPMHNSIFCKNCTRLRLTSDGKLKPCLMRDDNLVEAVDIIRSGGSKKDVIDSFKKAVKNRQPYWRD